MQGQGQRSKVTKCKVKVKGQRSPSARSRSKAKGHVGGKGGFCRSVLFLFFKKKGLEVGYWGRVKKSKKCEKLIQGLRRRKGERWKEGPEGRGEMTNPHRRSRTKQTLGNSIGGCGVSSG